MMAGAVVRAVVLAAWTCTSRLVGSGAPFRTRVDDSNDARASFRRRLERGSVRGPCITTLRSVRREDSMKTRVSWALAVLCAGLAGTCAGATATADTETLTPAETRAVDVDPSETVQAVETGTTRAADAISAQVAAPVEEKESDGEGIFSSILQWFRGRSAQPPRDGKPAHGRLRPPGDDVKDVTLSHVYQATLDLIAELHILRTATGAADSPREFIPREDRTPIHAFAKSLEVMDKTARVQRRLGMIPVDVGQIPVKTISPRDSYRKVHSIIEELRRIKRQLVIAEEIQPAPFVGGKTPALIYKNLGDASFLLDGLVGRPTTSSDAYTQVLQVHDEMELIATELGVALESDPSAVDGRKESKEVAQQIVRATYKAINLQSRLGMDASSVPDPVLVEVTPAEVLDATNILLAELTRVKVHLNVRSPRVDSRASQNKLSEDVFAQALLIIRNLDTLTKAAGGAS